MSASAFEFEAEVGSFDSFGSPSEATTAESGVRIERRRHRKKQRIQRKRRERAQQWRGR